MSTSYTCCARSSLLGEFWFARTRINTDLLFNQFYSTDASHATHLVNEQIFDDQNWVGLPSTDGNVTFPDQLAEAHAQYAEQN